MSSITRSDLIEADAGEIVDFLITAGFSAVRVEPNLDAGSVAITVESASESEIADALAGFTPTAERGGWIARLPPEVALHVEHLRGFRTAVRDGAQAEKTGAQRMSEAEHVLADVIDALRMLVDRRLE